VATSGGWGKCVVGGLGEGFGCLEGRGLFGIAILCEGLGGEGEALFRRGIWRDPLPTSRLTGSRTVRPRRWRLNDASALSHPLCPRRILPWRSQIQCVRLRAGPLQGDSSSGSGSGSAVRSAPQSMQTPASMAR
jgi:hypothetical protein